MGAVIERSRNWSYCQRGLNHHHRYCCSYATESEAEDAAKNVACVKAVVEITENNFGHSYNKSDNEVAIEVLKAFDSNFSVSDEKVIAKVEKGWVTLEAELHWNYQIESSENSVENFIRVRGIPNNLKIKTQSHDTLKNAVIQRGHARNLSIDNEDIKVNVSGNNVTLTGMVDSIYQKEEAGRIAWNAPGVYSVNNELGIEYDGWLD